MIIPVLDLRRKGKEEGTWDFHPCYWFNGSIAYIHKVLYNLTVLHKYSKNQLEIDYIVTSCRKTPFFNTW